MPSIARQATACGRLRLDPIQPTGKIKTPRTSFQGRLNA